MNKMQPIRLRIEQRGEQTELHHENREIQLLRNEQKQSLQYEHRNIAMNQKCDQPRLEL